MGCCPSNECEEEEDDYAVPAPPNPSPIFSASVEAPRQPNFYLHQQTVVWGNLPPAVITPSLNEPRVIQAKNQYSSGEVSRPPTAPPVLRTNYSFRTNQYGQAPIPKPVSLPRSNSSSNNNYNNARARDPPWLPPVPEYPPDPPTTPINENDNEFEVAAAPSSSSVTLPPRITINESNEPQPSSSNGVVPTSSSNNTLSPHHTIPFSPSNSVLSPSSSTDLSPFAPTLSGTATRTRAGTRLNRGQTRQIASVLVSMARRHPPMTLDPSSLPPSTISPTQYARPKNMWDNEAQKSCVVCLEADREIVFVPCRHLCCCTNCFRKLKNCPMCRTDITGAFVVYLS